MKISHLMTISAMALCASAQANTNYTVVPIEDGLSGRAVFSIAQGDNGDIALTTRDDSGAFFSSYIYDGEMNPVIGFDTLNDEGNYDKFLVTYVKSIAASGTYVGAGSSTISAGTYLNELGVSVNYLTADFWRRGFVVENGQITSLTPEIDSVYSFSEANSISEQGHIAGSMTTQLSSALQTSIDNCNDDDSRGLQPLEACLSALSNGLGSELLRSDLLTSSVRELSAVIWTKDEQSEWQYTAFPSLITFDEDDTRMAFSRAVAVNDHGVAVGISLDYYQDFVNSATNQRSVSVFPAIFKDEATTSILDDLEYSSGTAIDINNSNQVIGYGSKIIAGVSAKQMFIHNIDTNQTIYPDSLGDGADSVPTAINESGVVVGFGQSSGSTGGSSFYTSVSVSQELTGFIYDPEMDAESIIDLNTKISCDSPYTIVRANDISDDGTILADAAIQLETTDSSGNSVTVSTVKAVQLVPDSEAENCEPVINTDGASGSPHWMVLLLSFVAPFRRKLS